MVYPVLSDEYFMNEALKEAHKAMDMEEVPVGAVVVNQNRIIARAHNMTQQLNDVTAHAEMIAITSAANYLGAKYLTECTLYVTLEPCVMCAAALKWAQLGSLVFAASDPKEGFSHLKEKILHKKTVVLPGMLEEEASLLLKQFFLKRRDSKN
ncbi:MAG: nucleoside deaminase [Bacteroidetes bacterium]|nr:MAG: nucleoside deaminase [Bacteroidota bacterium]RLE05791.1 MAG: nucleoside deaminase [Bacteroidota bacterium]